ncbi:hypothetical protein HOLleu_08723 [Holothuria leucospilota]|uniref:Uncharacterized protein n=1 Tax=Holothuria leucospilota TaxID=206669 RepID=A0A9Q1HI14_HOLLE|nr:hypothetical protein HOLleu_08723 [Holothuria leucospilota]
MSRWEGAVRAVESWGVGVSHPQYLVAVGKFSVCRQKGERERKRRGKEERRKRREKKGKERERKGVKGKTENEKKKRERENGSAWPVCYRLFRFSALHLIGPFKLKARRQIDYACDGRIRPYQRPSV